MKNLIVANNRFYDVDVNPRTDVEGEAFGSVTSRFSIASPIAFNAAAQMIYFCDASLQLIGYCLHKECAVFHVPLVSDVEEESAVPASAKVISLSYVPDSEAVVIFMNTGTILEISTVDSAPSMDFMDDDEREMMEEFGGDMDFDLPEAIDAGSINIVGEVEAGISST